MDRAVSVFSSIYKVDLGEAQVPRGGFRSFDEFFTRRLAAGARPCDPDPRALVSPADGVVEDFGPIDESACLFIKGREYSVQDLLIDDVAVERYRGGQYVIIYLSPRHYHRVHAPASGRVEELRHVPGTLYPVNSIGTDHVDKVFAQNERIAMRQNDEHLGHVTTVMVGAIGVGRITVSFDDVITNRGRAPGVRRYGEDGPPIARGEELGVFHLGSTAIVFVEPACPVSFEATRGSEVVVGEAIARRR